MSCLYFSFLPRYNHENNKQTHTHTHTVTETDVTIAIGEIADLPKNEMTSDSAVLQPSYKVYDYSTSHATVAMQRLLSARTRDGCHATGVFRVIGTCDRCAYLPRWLFYFRQEQDVVEEKQVHVDGLRDLCQTFSAPTI